MSVISIMTITELNYWVALGAVVLQLGTLALLALYIFKVRALVPITNLLERYGLVAGFLVSLFGIVMSLVYSDYYGVVPCGLCWLSRVLLYPQAVLFGVAILKRDFNIADYSIVLSVGGAIVSLYHHYLQMTGGGGLPCPAAGAVDCAKRIIFEFGYMTFPMIGFSLFAFLIVVMLFVRRRAHVVS